MSVPLEPKRVLHRYSRERQDRFSAMSAAERLSWLEDIRWLYWEAARSAGANR